MYELMVETCFSSAHQLRGYKGVCEKLHGHNWKVEVIVSGKRLDKAGMVIDFKKLKSRMNKVLNKLDHKHINRLEYFKRVNPTSENIAKYIFDNLRPLTANLKSVTVWESDSSSATYYRE